MQNRIFVICVVALAAMFVLTQVGTAAVMEQGGAARRPPIYNPPRDTGTVVYQFTAPFNNIDGMTWDGEYIWVGCDGLDSLWKMDTLGNILLTIPAPNTTATGMCWDGQYLWCADGVVLRIYKLDPTTGAIIDSIPAPVATSCEGLAWMNDTMWNTNWGNNIIYALDPTNGNVFFQYNAPNTGSTGLAWDWHDSALWNTSQTAPGNIYKLDPATGIVITSFASPDPIPQDLAFDGTYLWTCGWTTGIVYKMDIGYVQPPADILFVDDDEDGPNVESYYETSFNNLGLAYDKWVVYDSAGVAPNAAVMANYEIVVWATGEDYSNTLTPTDTTEIGLYLLNVMNPGKMWLSSQDVLYDIGPVSWMHVGSHTDDIGCTQATGIGSIMTGTSFSTTGIAVEDYADEINPDGTSWTEMQNETGLSNTIAMNPPYSYYLFFNGFAYENINAAADRDTMMYRVINWLQTGIEEIPIKDTPYAFGFAPSMANPVRGRSPIAYNTSAPGRVSLKVYDSAGRLVKTLINSVESAGAKTVLWDAKDDNQRAVANGIYFFKLDAEGQTATHKLILVK